MNASVVILGSGTAVQTAERDNTALAFRAGGLVVLADCSGSPAMRLLRAGIDPMALDAVVITHAHPDHLYGFPSLVHNLRLLDRRTPLPIFTPAGDIERLHRLLAVFDMEPKAGFLEMRPLPADPGAAFWEHDGHRFFARAVDHSVPTYAIRWDLQGGARVVYSSDTRPVEALAEFGRDADLFIHEATFPEAERERAQRSGHSTPGQAGRLAALAEARRLLLVHVDIDTDPERWVAEARSAYPGPIEVPADGAVYPVGEP